MASPLASSTSAELLGRVQRTSFVKANLLCNSWQHEVSKRVKWPLHWLAVHLLNFLVLCS